MLNIVSRFREMETKMTRRSYFTPHRTATIKQRALPCLGEDVKQSVASALLAGMLIRRGPVDNRPAVKSSVRTSHMIQ